MNDHEFFTKLKEICLNFDAKAGYFPDPELVGLTLLKFALNPDIDMELCTAKFGVGDDEYDNEMRNRSMFLK